MVIYYITLYITYKLILLETQRLMNRYLNDIVIIGRRSGRSKFGNFG